MDRPLFLPAPPRLSRADLLAKLVRANEVFPEKEEGLMKYAEQVPLGLMLPARDLMRGPGQQHFDRPGDAWTGLSNDIAERGILSPIFLEWSTADGYAYAGEGNTRLAVAQELGLPTVPVVVYRKSLPLQGQSRGGEIGPFEFNKRQYLLDQGMTEDMPSWEFKISDGYVPQYFQPHYLIGFMDQRTSGRLDLPDKYRDEDDWHPYEMDPYPALPPDHPLRPHLQRFDEAGKLCNGWTCDGGAAALYHYLRNQGFAVDPYVGLYHWPEERLADKWREMEGGDPTEDDLESYWDDEHHHWVVVRDPDGTPWLIDPNGEIRGEPRVQNWITSTDYDDIDTWSSDRRRREVEENSPWYIPPSDEDWEAGYDGELEPYQVEDAYSSEVPAWNHLFAATPKSV